MIRRSLSVSVFAVLMSCLLVVASHSQAEHLTTKDGMGVDVGRGRSFTEHVPGKNYVLITARHCQAYEHTLAKLSVAMGFSPVDVEACAKDSKTLYFSHEDHNLRTTAGGDWQASVMGNTSAPPATANYIGLTNDAAAAAIGDTVLASEIATNGLSRAIGTYAHTGGTASYTIQKVFSATGTQASQKAGLFNASSSGTMVFENTYTQVTVNNGDTLTVTWTINY